jgi:hypothetical protein
MSRDERYPVTGSQPAVPSNSAANGRVVPPVGQPGHGELTASLRRQRVPPGRLEDGYTGAFEVICGDCGDYPDRVTSRSRPGCSGSAARITRSKWVLPPTWSTSGWLTDRGRRALCLGGPTRLWGAKTGLAERAAPARFGES